MATEKRELHEPNHSSYEKLAEGFSSKLLGKYATRIYMVTINSPWDHFVIVSNTKPHESPADSPYIQNFELVWSKDKGTIIPYGKNPDEYRLELAKKGFSMAFREAERESSPPLQGRQVGFTFNFLMLTPSKSKFLSIPYK